MVAQSVAESVPKGPLVENGTVSRDGSEYVC